MSLLQPQQYCLVLTPKVLLRHAQGTSRPERKRLLSTDVFLIKPPSPSMHYGFSYHFSGNGTFYFQINIVTSIFIENCWNLFYMIDNSQKIMPNIFWDQIWPIFAEIFTKNMKGSPDNSEILCVNQIDRDLKKSRKQQFYLRTPSRCKYLPNIFCHNIFERIFGARLTWQHSTRPSTSFGWPL